MQQRLNQRIPTIVKVMHSCQVPMVSTPQWSIGPHPTFIRYRPLQYEWESPLPARSRPEQDDADVEQPREDKGLLKRRMPSTGHLQNIVPNEPSVGRALRGLVLLPSLSTAGLRCLPKRLLGTRSSNR